MRTALKVEGAMSQGMWAASGKQKSKETGSPLGTPERNQSSNTLILAQYGLGQASDLQNCKMMDVCSFESLSLW